MTINSKSTKAEILAAYKDLEKEKKALEAAAKRVTATASDNINSPKNNSSTVKVERVLEMIKEQIEQRDIAKTIKILEQLQVGFGGAVSNLSEQLITEATTLTEIRELIAEEQQQLVELHELETIEENTIDNLIEQYQDSYKQFSEEFELESENKRQEIAELIKTWNKEQETYHREIKARNEERKKNKQRETEEYQYNLDLARDLDEEEYEQQKKIRTQELETIKQELEQQWQDKEEAIAEKEKEYTEAKEKVTEFEEKLRKKVKQGEEEGKAIGNYQAKVKQDLRVKEIDGERQNYQLRIQSLTQTISNQEARMAKLIQQLDSAQKQVQDLAVKAIEGTANRQSYEAMREIAMEQAKTQQKNK
jgi:DNA repair exonuclease SbcCD ATPase subunit